MTVVVVVLVVSNGLSRYCRVEVCQIVVSLELFGGVKRNVEMATDL